MAGCDPGTMKAVYPDLYEEAARALVAKTGTLTETDGGVAVLAGFLQTAQGERLFAVAIPGSGTRQEQARKRIEEWTQDLIERHGGVRPGECAAEVVYSDTHAQVIASAPPDRLVF